MITQFAPRWIIKFLVIVVLLDSPANGLLCPPSSTIFPCRCLGPYTGLVIDCKNQGLNDTDISDIMDHFILPNFIHLVVSISAENNNLTVFPNQISQFKKLKNLNLSNNQITNIPSGAFNMTSTGTTSKITLDLRRNQIEMIPSGAFNITSQIGSVSIHLQENQIAIIEPDAFLLSSQFSSVVIDLHQNLITNISSGVFNIWSTPKMFLYLFQNQIESVEPGAFILKGTFRIVIDLFDNLITSIPTGVFDLECPSGDIFLNLHRNQISEVQSEAFVITASLDIYLHLYQNQLTDIQSGSFNIQSSSRSIFVDLQENAIVNIQTDAFQLKSDEYIALKLAFNNISSIQPGAFNNISSASIAFLDLSQNDLYSIPQGIFNLTEIATISLALHQNKISAIELDAFQGNYHQISLGNGNEMTRFESGVFKNVLQNMEKVYNITGNNEMAVNIYKNPINCTDDPCHLAWLIRDNPNLLEYVKYGECSNGTRFEHLNPFGFEDCHFVVNF